MARRFQFSIADLLRCALFAAIGCALFRLALAWQGEAWLRAMLDGLALACGAASLGSLWRRARFGVLTGLTVASVWISLAILGPLFTLFCLMFLAACLFLL